MILIHILCKSRAKVLPWYILREAVPRYPSRISLAMLELKDYWNLFGLVFPLLSPPKTVMSLKDKHDASNKMISLYFSFSISRESASSWLYQLFLLAYNKFNFIQLN